jgi:UDP-galactopyranose mutase
MTKVDYLIVGSGLTGAVIARSLVDAGKDVLVVDRRNHMGGNVHDSVHESGVRIHTYGPHYFRTSSKKIWDFATRFAKFYKYEAALLSDVDNELVQWPIAGSYITRKVGIDWAPEFKGKPSNLEEAALGLMPRLIYEKFIKEYNISMIRFLQEDIYSGKSLWKEWFKQHIKKYNKQEFIFGGLDANLHLYDCFSEYF